MGSFFKECGHPRSRWSKCPHAYKIRYRSAAGQQVEESGFAPQDDAIGRLTDVYKAKRAAPRGGAKAERVLLYGAMHFGEYAAEWKAGQRDLGPASVRHLESLLEHHMVPLLDSRRMDTFDPRVVEGFIRSMERAGVGLATQANAFDKLKAILLDAHRLGLFDDHPWQASNRRSTTPSARSSPHPPNYGRYAKPATTASGSSPT
ncbi:hypothetical protein [Streptomyces sp. NPDC005009]